MFEIFSSVEFWKFSLPLLGAVIAWFVNEKQKRLADQYERREASYKELLRSLQGFYVGAADADHLKFEFLQQLNLSWLYCPDEVIQKGYSFLEAVHTNQAKSDEEKELALGAFVAAVRKDILSRNLVTRTRLTAADFKHLRPNI